MLDKGALWIIVTLIILSGCGYSSPYSQTTKYDYDHDGKVTVYLEMWENHTNLFGFQATIQQSLTNWLKKSQRFILTQNRDNADFIFSGHIHSIDIPGLSYGNYDRASEVRLEARMTYQLMDRHSQQVVMTKKKFLKQQTVAVATDSVHTRSNQQAALVTMADSVADDIYIQLFYLFTHNELIENRQIVPTETITSLE